MYIYPIVSIYYTKHLHKVYCDILRKKYSAQQKILHSYGTEDENEVDEDENVRYAEEKGKKGNPSTFKELWLYHR